MITAHLKILAVRLSRTMNELMAEALEDLFREHRGIGGSVPPPC
jgi:hypothetical protein